jgi:MraZ protein
VSPQSLSGSYDHSLDDKHRVIVPAQFRPALGTTFYLTTALSDEEKHLRMYEEAQFEKLVAQLQANIPPDDYDAQWQLRDFLADAKPVELDANNRVTLPQTHRDYAAIGKRVMFLGRQQYVEIWDAETFEQNRKRPARRNLASYLRS